MKDYNQLGIDFSRYTVLIVDDIPVNIMLMEKMLAPYNFRILKATNGPDAVSTVLSQHPNIMLLDIMMPGMDGFEVTRRIRAEQGIPYVPIIILSALNSESDVSRGFELGADDFIAKPIVRERLLTSVMMHVSQQEAQKRMEAGGTAGGNDAGGNGGVPVDKLAMYGAALFCDRPGGLLKDLAACMPLTLADDELFIAAQTESGMLAWATARIRGAEVSPVETDAAAPLSAIMESVTPVARVRGIFWDLEREPGLKVTADPVFYSCVLTGMLAYACRISAGGAVRVKMAGNNGRLSFSVQGKCTAAAGGEGNFVPEVLKEMAAKLGGVFTAEVPANGSFQLLLVM